MRWLMKESKCPRKLIYHEGEIKRRHEVTIRGSRACCRLLTFQYVQGNVGKLLVKFQNYHETKWKKHRIQTCYVLKHVDFRRCLSHDEGYVLN